MKNVASTEYAVEIKDKSDRFVKQVEVFPTYEEAVRCWENKENEIVLADGEYLNIIFIDYDENGDEICFGSVC